MLRRVAASCVAACLFVWPVRSGVDVGTLADLHAEYQAADELRVPQPMPAPLQPPRVETPMDKAAVAAADATDNGAVGKAAVGVAGSAALAADEGLIAAAPSPVQPVQPVQPVSPNVATREAAPPVLSTPPAEPFGLDAEPVSSGDVVSKWRGVESAIRAGNDILARCRADAAGCPQAAKKFLAIVAQGSALTGRMRIGVINRAINLAIEPESDLKQWGVADRWSPPLETFATGRGDCEDYAIAKYVALTAAGVPRDDVKLIIVRNTEAREDHAVVAARDGGEWIVLDNRWLAMVADAAMPNAVPRFVLDHNGVRKFASPAIASRKSATPASLSF